MEKTSAARFYAGPEPDDSASETLVRALHHLELGNRSLRGAYAAALDLTISEFNALTTIGRAGEVTPKELSGTLHMTTGAVTALVDRLATAGLAERRSHPTDRRSLLIAPTAQGYEALDWVVESYYAAIAKIVANEAEFLHPTIAELLYRAAQALAEQADALSDDSRSGRRVS
jgi:DNA-binding MarR family transcriptional regulator